MLHFTCDLCGQELHAGKDLRYIVKMEVFAAPEPLEITEEDLDQDHMQEISKLLDQMEQLGTQELEDDVCKSLRFDLCPECRAKFLKDPLGRDSLQRIDFSEN